MKILAVHFLNLNSLKGEHTIRFDQAPFTESGLFAITGPTGSGKTTILDAITVALYGRVHRHDKNVEEMMSRNTSESYSEVEFEVQGKQYRSKWSKKRSRGKIVGTLQSDKMELCELSRDNQEGTYIGGHTTTQVKQAIIELCGLDYDQFLRSVILSQGDFTRFLKATDSERSELLEKITGTGIYSEISKYVYTRKKKEQGILENCKAKLNGTAVLPEERKAEFSLLLTDQSAREQALKDLQSGLASKIQWIQNVEKIQERQKKILFDLAKEMEVQELQKEEFTRLQQHMQASAFQTELAILQTKKEHIHKLEAEAIVLTEKLPLSITLAEAAREALDKSVQGVLLAEQEYATAEPLLVQAGQLDTRIAYQKELTEKEHQQLLAAEQQWEDLQEKHLHTAASEKTQTQELDNLKSWLKLNEPDKELERYLPVFTRSMEDLQELKKNIHEACDEQEKLRKLEQEQRTALSANALKIQSLEKTCRDENEQLHLFLTRQQNLLEEHSLDTLQQEAALLPVLIHTCEEANRLSVSHSKNKDTKDITTGLIHGLQASLKTHTFEHTSLLTEKEALQNHIADLSAKLEAEQRIQSYEEARGELTPGEPCFLCGSLEHPFAEGGYASAINETARKKNMQETILNELLKKTEDSSTALTSEKVTLQLKEKEIHLLDAQQQELLKEFNILNLSLPKPLDIEKQETIFRVLESKKVKYSGILKLLSELDLISKDIHRITLHISGLQGELSLENEKSASIQERLEAAVKLFTDWELVISSSGTKQAALIQEHKTLLKPYEIEFKEEALQAIQHTLTLRAAGYARTALKVQELTPLVARLASDLQNLTSLLDERTTALHTLRLEGQTVLASLSSLQVKRIELLGDTDPAHERSRYQHTIKSAREQKDADQKSVLSMQGEVKLIQASLKKIETDSIHLEREYNDLHALLLRKLNLKNIPSVQILLEQLLPAEEAEKLVQLEKRLQETIASLKQELKKIKVELDTEQQKQLTTDREMLLTAQLETTQTQLAELYEEIGKVKQILDEDAHTRRRFTALALEIENQQGQFSKWEKLDKLIGSADGKSFSRFAQGLTLARLTELANKHLGKLSDRYQILKSEADDLELLIIDAYQADAIRPMTTLSGGESFLVSLALAFGLSDLASKKVQIDTLFIDEGFGSLDADTLDTAISALENLQSKGKTIGIISHVEALKDRIATQIQLSKQSGGISKIFIESYLTRAMEV